MHLCEVNNNKRTKHARKYFPTIQQRKFTKKSAVLDTKEENLIIKSNAIFFWAVNQVHALFGTDPRKRNRNYNLYGYPLGRRQTQLFSQIVLLKTTLTVIFILKKKIVSKTVDSILIWVEFFDGLEGSSHWNGFTYLD